MSKKQALLTLKPLTLKKQCTINETKRQKQEWALPKQKQCLKALLLLAITRKVVKHTSKIVKEKEDRQNKSLTYLRKLYSCSNDNRKQQESINNNIKLHQNITIKNSQKESQNLFQKMERIVQQNQMNHSPRLNNSFDFISPINPAFMKTKETKEAFLQLKKNILAYFKQLKKEYLSTQRSKVSNTVKFLTQANCFSSTNSNTNTNLCSNSNSNTTNAYNVDITNPAQKIKKLMNTSLSKSLQKNINNPFLCAVQTQPTQRQEIRNDHIISNLFSSSRQNKFKALQSTSSSHKKKNQDNFHIIDAKYLQNRISNQTQIFKKFNQTINKFYTNSDKNIHHNFNSNKNSKFVNSANQSKGFLQLLQLYLSNLLEIKSSIANNHSKILALTGQFSQRVIYQIRKICQFNQSILGLCQLLAKEHQSTFSKLTEEIKLYHDNTNREQQNKKLYYQADKNVSKVSTQVGLQKANTKQQFLTQTINELMSIICCIKIVARIPNLTYYIRLQSNSIILAELIEKISEVRYVCRYLNTELKYMKRNCKNKFANQQKENKENKGAKEEGIQQYVSKWSKVYEKKFRNKKTNFLIY